MEIGEPLKIIISEPLELPEPLRPSEWPEQLPEREPEFEPQYEPQYAPQREKVGR